MTENSPSSPTIVEMGLEAFLADIRSKFETLDLDEATFDPDLLAEQLDKLETRFAAADDFEVTLAELEAAIGEMLQDKMTQIIESAFGDTPADAKEDFSFQSRSAIMIAKIDTAINNSFLLIAGISSGRPPKDWAEAAVGKSQVDAFRSEMIYSLSIIESAMNLGRQLGSSHEMFSGEDGHGALLAAFTLDALRLGVSFQQLALVAQKSLIAKSSFASLSAMEIDNPSLKINLDFFLQSVSLDEESGKYVIKPVGNGNTELEFEDYQSASKALQKELMDQLEAKQATADALTSALNKTNQEIADKFFEIGVLENEKLFLSGDNSELGQAARNDIDAEINKLRAEVSSLEEISIAQKNDLDTRKQVISEYKIVTDSLEETNTKYANSDSVALKADAAYKLLGIGVSISSMLANGLSGEHSEVGYASAGMNMAADLIDGLAVFAKYKDSYEGFQTGAGAVAGVIGVGPQIAAFTQAILDLKDAPEGYEGYYIGEAVVQGANLAMGLAIGAMTTYAALAGTTVSSAVPVLGMMASLASAVNPLQWASFDQQNDHLDDVRAKTDIESDAYETSADFLSQLLETTRNIEVGYYAAEASVGAGGGIAASAAAATGYGAPVALAIAGVTAGLQGLLAATKQAALNQAAENIANKIRNFDGGVEGFFDQSFEHQSEKELEAFFDQAQALIDQGFDSVTALGSVQMTASDLELAGLSGIGGEMARTQDHFAGHLESDDLDTGDWDTEEVKFKESGTIVFGEATEEATGKTNMLKFITPMAAAGEEELDRDKTGKRNYETTLEIRDLTGWTLIDGGDSTTFDLRNVVTKARKSAGASLEDIEMVIHGNEGDDMFLMTETTGSQTNSSDSANIDGGAGQDTVTYASLTHLTKGLQVRTNSAGNLIVEKTIDADTTILEGAIGSYEVQRGKETERVEYSYINVKAIGQVTTFFDELTNIEMLALSDKDDDAQVASYNEALIIAGLGGDDLIQLGQGHSALGGEGDDSFLLAGDLKTVGETENDLPETVEISGGEGFDTILLQDNWGKTLFQLGAHYLIAEQILAEDAALLEALMPTSLASEIGEDIAVATVANILSEGGWAMTSVLAFEGIENVNWDLRTMIDVVFEGGVAELGGLIDLGEFVDAAKSLLDLSTVGDYEGRITYDASKLSASSGEMGYVIEGTSGNEGIRGTVFADVLFGGDGDDWLDGHGGTNRLIGAGGADTFYFDMALSSDTTISLVDFDLTETLPVYLDQTFGDAFHFDLGDTPTTQLSFSQVGEGSRDLEISSNVATVLIESYFTEAYADFADGSLFSFSASYGEGKLTYDGLSAYLGRDSNLSLSIDYMGPGDLYILAGQAIFGASISYFGQNAYKGDHTNLITGDFDGDGNTDFIEQRETGDHRAYVNLATGKGTFGFDGGLHNNSGEFRGDLTNLIVGDFNGDGKDDFIRQEKGRWDDDTNRTAEVFFASGDGDFYRSGQLNQLAGRSDVFKGDLTNLIIGDFNGDGRDDLIKQEKGRWDDDDANTAQLYLSQSNGTFKLNGQLQNLTGQEQDIFKGDDTRLIAGDFNGDGLDDFIRQDYAVGDDYELTTEVYLATGGGKFELWDDLFRLTGQSSDAFNGDNTKIYIDDFNGDNRDDFIVQDDTESVDVYLAQELIDGFTYETSKDLGSKKNVTLITGDFDGDGDADVIRQEFGALDNDRIATAQVYEFEFV